MIKKGDLVIMNDMDRPEAKMIVKITSIKKIRLGYKYYGKYISEKMKKVYGNKLCWAFRKTKKENTPTRIEDFGVKAIVKDGVINIEKIGETKATYDDGHDRYWQNFDSCELRKDMEQV